MSDCIIEIWRKIPGFNGWYFVSDKGRIYSTDKIFYDKNGMRKFYKGKILKQRLQNSGYNVVDLYDDKNHKHTILVHRLVALMFVNNPKPEKYNMVDHIDRNKLNNNVENLRWVNNSINSKNKDKKKPEKYNIILRNPDTNEIVHTFTKVSDAAHFINRDPKVIRNILNGDSNIKHGYMWEKSSTTTNTNDGMYTIYINV